MNKKILFVLAVTAISFGNAQTKIDQAIETLESKYTQEKVYLLLDKNEYIAGDTIIFKSFVFEGYNRSNISTTLFVELYDGDKKLLEKKTILLKNGEGSGSIAINEDTKEDIYYARAYTPWMANFPDAFNYIKPIPIYNTSSPQKLTSLSTAPWSISAIPEGGNLINNTPTKIAVRFLTEGTSSADWNGYLIDTENPSEKLVNFKALDQNIALFTFTPKLGSKYQIIVQNKSGEKQIADLSPVQSSGAKLNISNDASGIEYTVKGINIPNGLKDYKIIGTIANRLAYRANIKNNTSEVSSIIPPKVNSENNGVLQLAVFDDKDNLVAQRLCFIESKNSKLDSPDLNNINLTDKPRSFNSFDIIPNDNYLHYTVIVRDASDMQNNNKENDNLLSALWFTQDFKNPLQAPAQYFSGTSNTEALDALMISEKWMRFNWSAILNGQIPVIKYQPQKYLSYKGKLAINSKPLPNTVVNLVIKPDYGDQSFSQLKTDAMGYIYLNDITIDKPVNVQYYLGTEKGKENLAVPDNLTLTLEPMVLPTSFSGNLPKTNYTLTTAKVEVPTSITRGINNKNNLDIIRKDEIKIEEVTIRAKKTAVTEKLDWELTSPMFKSPNSKVFDFINDNESVLSFNNIFQWLEGKIPNYISERNSTGTITPYIRNSPATIYLDEVQSSSEEIATIHPSNIALLKVIKGNAALGGGNIIAIYLKKGNMESVYDTKEKVKNNKTQLIGYSQPYNFEQPDYSKDVYKKITNDTRELLYFNPEITEDSGLPARVKFFSNDQSKAYDVTIIGFDKNDKPLFYNQILK